MKHTARKSANCADLNAANPSTSGGTIDLDSPWWRDREKKDVGMVSEKYLRGMAFAISLCSIVGLAAVTLYEILLILSQQSERIEVRIGLVLAFSLFGAGVVFARALTAAKNDLPQHS